MALVQECHSDFVLFPREQPYLEMLESRQDDAFENIVHYTTASDMNHHFSDLASTTYDAYPSNSSFSAAASNYYGGSGAASNFAIDAPKENDRLNQRQFTPSGSPSPSMSQSFDHPPSILSSTSGASAQSTASSAAGSPYSHETNHIPSQEHWTESHQGLGIAPAIVHHEGFGSDLYPLTNISSNDIIFGEDKFSNNFVDPSLIQPFDSPITQDTTTAPYPGVIHAFHTPSQNTHPHSPALSEDSSHDSHRVGSTRFRSGTSSPYHRTVPYPPYPTAAEARRLSIASTHSRNSQESPRSSSMGYEDDGKERGRCPNPECGRLFKDLKAHMLTHQSERPEKCPIVTCDYHQKGFARKYDKNRHTLTHYKGNMVCGFCPGSGSAAEKSFNRADVFKRHLTSVHGVEQTPPNSRKKSPTTSSVKKISSYSHDATGKCSTCSAMFNNAQEFYEHLDDCVLRVVQQEEPSESINEQRLAEVADDQAVRETLDRNMLPSGLDHTTRNPTSFDEEDEEDEVDDLKDEGSDENWATTISTNPRSGKGIIKSNKGNSS